MSGQSVVLPPPTLSSHANENVEMQNPDSAILRELQASPRQLSKKELLDCDEAGGGTGIHSPMIRLRTKVAPLDGVHRTMVWPPRLARTEIAPSSSQRMTFPTVEFIQSNTPSLRLCIPVSRDQPVLHHATPRGGLIQPRSMCHNCAAPSHLPTTGSLALVILHSCL